MLTTRPALRMLRSGLFALTSCALLLSPAHAADSKGAPKIDPWVYDNTRAGAQAEFFVVLADQADLSGAARLKTKLAKNTYVYNKLYEKALATQGPILEELELRGATYRSFYLVNAILVTGDRALAESLAQRPDVKRIDGNPSLRAPLPQPEEPQPLEWNPDWTPPENILAVEPGINYVRAPSVWSLGYNGQGIVIGGADTGYRWTHATLKNKYRGWNGTTASHDYNWHDSVHTTGSSCGANATAPCDDGGHGTHTMGTMVGDDGGTNQIGMAPGARWIGCRNMNAGAGTPATYLECMEWFLAPYPVGGTTAQGDPSKAPDVTNNSWGCPASEGCTTANILLTGVSNTRAAGIVMVVSAGNSGSGCSTISDPPSFYDPSFTVGALNTGADTLATFSSRGPVTADGSNRVKPDIAAPGTSTRSAYNTSDTGYSSLSGTSMAGPHVAGGVAVLMSAFPSLIGNVDAVESRLTSSAKKITLTTTTCSSAAGVTPNNLFGHGRLDVGCAVPAAVTGSTAVCSGSPATLSVNLIGTGPWTLTWSDGFVQNVSTSPATRVVSPTSATTYSLTSVSQTGCNQPGAGSATVSIAPPLTGVSISVAGSTTIGSPCTGGTATVTETGGGSATRQWGYRTVSGGAITAISGATGSSYVLNCANFPAAGNYFLVETSTPGCGSATVSNEVPVTVTSVPPPNPVTVTFYSVAAQDGRLWEVGETTNVGGSGNSTDNTTAALRVGDTNADEQYKSLVSFDTSSIPDTATITSATLRLVRGTLSGTSPFSTHGSCVVDISNGGFGGNTTFASSDWQAAATATSVATMSSPASNGSASTGNLNAAGLAAINKTGTTQLRLTFTLDDNDDVGYDYIGFYAGENTTTANKPQLTITYNP